VAEDRPLPMIPPLHGVLGGRYERARWFLGAGLRYEGREPCGCAREPKYRPRTRAQLRARVRESERSGVPLAEALARPEPSQPCPRTGGAGSVPC
jgi:hypothetical protein